MYKLGESPEAVSKPQQNPGKFKKNQPSEQFQNRRICQDHYQVHSQEIF